MNANNDIKMSKYDNNNELSLQLYYFVYTNRNGQVPDRMTGSAHTRGKTLFQGYTGSNIDRRSTSSSKIRHLRYRCSDPDIVLKRK